jgi:hypothetical protein
MTLAKIDHTTLKPGDKVDVMVGGVLYPTVLDEDGVQRFVENPDHFLVKRLREYSKGGNPKGDVADLNEMAERYDRQQFSKRDYAEMNMAIGYSVCGFADLSGFQDWEIDNPIW